jgi:hypothetical protein
MGFPFGAAPTFRDYMAWAHTQGCAFASSIKRTPSFCHQITTIRAPNGRHVIVSDIPPSERLEPSMVTYLDRRLGLSSPFPAAPWT